MSTLSKRDRAHIFECLRTGLVPERGIDAFAVGIEQRRAELHRQLALAAADEGTIKFLRGGYGCGKTFMARLAVLDAQEQGFATSFVVVSDNDLRFHRFDDVYGKVMSELGTGSCPRGALGDILDRWIGNVEDALISGGADEDDPGFDGLVSARLQDDLVSKTAGQAPQDLVRVVQTIFELKQRGDTADAGSLLSWLSGSKNVAHGAKKAAGVKGDIDSSEALEYLRGILAIVRAAGYRGLLIVIDEAETILRMRSDTRHKSLNGIRQIADAAGSNPGLVWLFTGTPEFFDTRHGVAGLAPLHDRIRFLKSGKTASFRQPQLELTPFDAERLRAVALRLRELYPIEETEPGDLPDRDPIAERERLERLVSDEFIQLLVGQVTAGFRGDVGVVPRQFLRSFVDQMDLVRQDAEYVPMKEAGFEPSNLSAEEQAAIDGGDSSDDDELAPRGDVW